MVIRYGATLGRVDLVNAFSCPFHEVEIDSLRIKSAHQTICGQESGDFVASVEWPVTGRPLECSGWSELSILAHCLGRGAFQVPSAIQKESGDKSHALQMADLTSQDPRGGHHLAPLRCRCPNHGIHRIANGRGSGTLCVVALGPRS